MDRLIYLLNDTAETRKLMNQCIAVYEYHNSRIELRAKGIVPNQKKRPAGSKKQRAFTAEDLTAAVCK